MRDKVGMGTKIINFIVHAHFDEEGLSSVQDMATFQGQQDDALSNILPCLADSASNYILNKIVPLLKSNLQAGRPNWTNNNCESANHILKSAIRWKAQDLPQLINTIQTIVDAKYVDANRALFGQDSFACDRRIDDIK